MFLVLSAFTAHVAKSVPATDFHAVSTSREIAKVSQRVNLNDSVNLDINCLGRYRCHFESRDAANDLVTYISSLPDGVFYPDGSTIGAHIQLQPKISQLSPVASL